MGFAVLADETTIRLAGDASVPESTRKQIENETRTQIDLADIPSGTHLGYAKVRDDGDVIVDFFAEFERPLGHHP